MKTMLKNTLTLFVVSLLITTACQTPDRNQPPYEQPLTEQKTEQKPEDTSTFQQKQVTALTTEERNTFNESTQKTLNETMYTDDNIYGTCSINAAFMTGLSSDDDLTNHELQANCVELRNQCIAETNEDRETDVVSAMQIPTDCAITVAEFESCIRAMLEDYQSMVSNYVECESHDIESFKNASTEYPLAAFGNPPPKACQLVQQKCPGAF